MNFSALNIVSRMLSINNWNLWINNLLNCFLRFNYDHHMYLIDISKIYRLICPSADVECLCATCLMRYMKEWDRQGSNRQDISQKDNSRSKMTRIMISAVSEAHSTVRQREYLDGERGPQGAAHPSRWPLSSAKSWEEARCVGGPGGRARGAQHVHGYKRVQCGWSGKASDTCWMEEMVEGRGTRSHRAFGL